MKQNYVYWDIAKQTKTSYLVEHNNNVCYYEMVIKYIYSTLKE